ncbi:MAG: hypothetical protein ACLQSR_16375 [Limisphaerales bacterium]
MGAFGHPTVCDVFSSSNPQTLNWKYVARVSGITLTHAGHGEQGGGVLREKLIKIGAKVVRHSRQIIFQMAEVTVPRGLFRAI